MAPLGCRLIVVDDHRDCGVSLTLLLRASGYCASTCSSARELLEQLDVVRPQALLLDVGMPGIDGLQLAVVIKELHPTLPLIAVTGRVLPGDRALATDAGFDYFLPKPVDLKKLVELLAELCPATVED